MKKQILCIEVKVDSKVKVYPHKDMCCYYEASMLYPLPVQPEGLLGGFFDELFPMKKGKKYRITVEEIK